MEQFNLKHLGAKVNFITDLPLKEYILKNKAFTEFEGAEVEDGIDENCQYYVIYKNSGLENSGVKSGKTKVEISYPISEMDEGSVLYAAAGLFEKQYALKSRFTCHSACVEKDGQATLFLGDAGAGKTSLALRLCLDKGYNLLSNDQTVIGLKNDKLYTFAGTKFINFRYLSVKNNLPDLLYVFDGVDVKDEWSFKKTVHARDIGIGLTNEAIIKKVYWVHATGARQLKVNTANSFGNNIKPYQNLSSHIRGAATTFHDKKGNQIGFMPSLETMRTDNNKKDVIEKIKNLDDYTSLSGGLNDIIDYIENN